MEKQRGLLHSGDEKRIRHVREPCQRHSVPALSCILLLFPKNQLARVAICCIILTER